MFQKRLRLVIFFLIIYFMTKFVFFFQVQTVSAKDPDAAANGQFQYSIAFGDSDDLFSIDGK